MASITSERRAVAHQKGHAPFTILVVEDDPSDTELILHALEQAELKAVEGDLEIEVRRQPKGL